MNSDMAKDDDREVSMVSLSSVASNTDDTENDEKGVCPGLSVCDQQSGSTDNLVKIEFVNSTYIIYDPAGIDVTSYQSFLVRIMYFFVYPL